MALAGIVAIGRNEGERLQRCLQSLLPHSYPIIYVDSGSTDGSVEYARSVGVEVVPLDLTIPFTAARARNAGWRRLIELHPDTEFVQFLDGDCELDAGWFVVALDGMATMPTVAVVCGRRRERFPEQTIYNRLCDLEWDTPIGPADACGGDALMRLGALVAAGGYRDDLIAGEEPELCVRLREQGGKVVRLDAEMTLHDAAMTRFSQWWKRNTRAGHAFAEVATTHRASLCRIWAKEVRSNWVWGGVLPLGVLLSCGLLLLPVGLLYVRLYFKIVRNRRQRGDDARTAKLYARYCVLSKIPQALGQWRYVRNRWRGKRTTLIEYKGQTPA